MHHRQITTADVKMMASQHGRTLAKGNFTVRRSAANYEDFTGAWRTPDLLTRAEDGAQSHKLSIMRGLNP